MPDTTEKKDHFALIVGIEDYQEDELKGLKGAKNDADEFYRWVTSPSGGAVPDGNVRLLKDSTIEQIERAFLGLCEPATTSGYAGKRLYVYLSGHGVAQDVHEASLLAADGGRNARDRHVPGWHWLSWFLASGYFSEVILFADCCRSVRGTWAVRRFPLDPINRASPARVRWVRGFAVQFGGKAIEEDEGLRSRGVFTRALLTALEHARQPDGTVTARSMSNYFFNSPEVTKWRRYQAPSLLADVGVDDLVLSTGGAEPREPVAVLVEDGERPTIVGGPKRPEPWVVRPGTRPGEFLAELPRGIYVAKAGGRSKPFEVPGGVRVDDVRL
ncbi:MAG TPA: caspase family protein [Myxococcaceae bacterium]|jgi:hypothetical protein